MARNMDAKKLHIRNCILYAFDRGLSGAAAAREICSVYGDDATSKATCERWYEKFRSGDKSLEDKPRSGRPSSIDDDELEKMISADPRLSTREMSVKFQCSHSTIEEHLHALGKVQKSGVWVPHELSDDSKKTRVAICASLLSRLDKEPFLDRLVTGDEKWVLYVNVTHKRQWLNPEDHPLPDAKADLHPKKVMLSIWWDLKGVIYFELLDNDTTITAEVYSYQLMQVQEALEEKRPALTNRKGVILLHDNARPHVAKMTQQKIKELGWEILPHPPYSPDIAPSDYHLFRSLQDHLAGKRYGNYSDIKNDLSAFFDSKSPEFYKKGIEQLPFRWAQIVDSDGEYFID